MKDLFSNPGFIALLGTLFGGAGLKVVESWLGKAKVKQDAGIAMRNELRLEIEGLRKQLTGNAQEEQRLEHEVERWRGMYYDLRDEKQKVVTELMIVMEQLKAIQRELEVKNAILDNKAKQ